MQGINIAIIKPKEVAYTSRIKHDFFPGLILTINLFAICAIANEKR